MKTVDNFKHRLIFISSALNNLSEEEHNAKSISVSEINNNNLFI